MPSSNPISLAARERLREHQATTARSVAAYSAALARLQAAVHRRTEVVAQHDALVAATTAEAEAAGAEVACLMGVDAAVTVLDLSKGEVRRILREASHGERRGHSKPVS